MHVMNAFGHMIQSNMRVAAVSSTRVVRYSAHCDFSNVVAFGHNELWCHPPHRGSGDPHTSSYIDYITAYAV